MKTLLVILIFALLISAILHAVGTAQDKGNILHWDHLLSIALSLVTILCLFAMFGVVRDTPTALDVYQGRTEMKYTLVMKGNDTVSVDSTVVFKKL